MKLIPWLMLLLVAGGLVWWQQAEARTPLFTWVQTTTPASAVLGVAIEQGTCNGADFGTFQYRWEIVGTQTRAGGPNVNAGVYCYRLQTRTAAGYSAWSQVVKLVVPASTCGSGCH